MKIYTFATCVDSYKCLWAFIGGFKRFFGLQIPLGITNGNRSHNKTTRTNLNNLKALLMITTIAK